MELEPTPRRRLVWLIWLGRGLAALLLVTAAVVGYRRLHRTGEQIELARYVESELPSLGGQENEVFARLARLNARPGLSSDAARALLVDDLVPRLLRLRKTAVSIEAHTEGVRALAREYLAWIDSLIEACRTSVRVIDDPTLDPAAGLARIRQRFAEADAAAAAWKEQVRATCVRNHM